MIQEVVSLRDKVGVKRVESCHMVFLGTLLVCLFRRFCGKVYRLATCQFLTDRQTDGRTDDNIMPI